MITRKGVKRTCPKCKTVQTIPVSVGSHLLGQSYYPCVNRHCDGVIQEPPKL
jgi:hypothetical protein